MVSVAPGVAVQVTPPSRPAVTAAPPAVVQVKVSPAGGPASLAVQVAPPSHPTVLTTPPAVASVQVAPIVGPRGPIGPPGGTGFSYVQTTPAASWPVVHNLGRHPYAVTLTVGTSQFFTDVDFPDLNTVVLTFAAPTAGRVDII